MIKGICNLIGRGHFGELTWVPVSKIKETFIFLTIFNLTPTLRSTKHTYGRFQEICVWWARLVTPNYRY